MCRAFQPALSQEVVLPHGKSNQLLPQALIVSIDPVHAFLLIEVVDLNFLPFVTINFEHVAMHRRFLMICLAGVDAHDAGAVLLVIFLYLVDLHEFHVFLHGLFYR